MDGVADSDGEWTFDYGNSRITHQRADNSRYYWAYDKGEQKAIMLVSVFAIDKS